MIDDTNPGGINPNDTRYQDTAADRRTGAGPRSARSSRTPAKPAKGKKVTPRLIALSAAAILSVYAVGYADTRSAAAQAAIPASVVASDATAIVGSATSGATTSTYKDGTYTDAGTSRHGGIQVQVAIQGGKIVSAQITGSSTRYPTSAIASLPGAVVAQQSPNVDYVSGATDSSMAYLGAVANALAQAT